MSQAGITLSCDFPGCGMTVDVADEEEAVIGQCWECRACSLHVCPDHAYVTSDTLLGLLENYVAAQGGCDE